MHEETREWVATHAEGEWSRVLEIGGRDLNGSVRDLFPGSFYWCIDLYDGPGVDEGADATLWKAPEPFDLVLCLEVFEHTPQWREILRTCAESLKPGGRCVLTMATDPRPAHSGLEATELQDGEFYANVPPDELEAELARRFSVWDVDVLPRGDLRAVAIK